MRLMVVAVPPPAAREHLAALLDEVGAGPEDLERVPTADLHVPLATFGNVTVPDARLVRRELDDACGAWGPVPLLRLAGGEALEFPGDHAVWARLGGDADTVERIGRALPALALRLGFALDRRRFRPWLPVGVVTPTTSLPVLERLLAALEAYEGPPWRLTEVGLARWTHDRRGGTRRTLEVFDAVALPAMRLLHGSGTSPVAPPVAGGLGAVAN